MQLQLEPPGGVPGKLGELGVPALALGRTPLAMHTSSTRSSHKTPLLLRVATTRCVRATVRCSRALRPSSQCARCEWRVAGG